MVLLFFYHRILSLFLDEFRCHHILTIRQTQEIGAGGETLDIHTNMVVCNRLAAHQFAVYVVNGHARNLIFVRAQRHIELVSNRIGIDHQIILCKILCDTRAQVLSLSWIR